MSHFNLQVCCKYVILICKLPHVSKPYRMAGKPVKSALFFPAKYSSL